MQVGAHATEALLTRLHRMLAPLSVTDNPDTAALVLISCRDYNHIMVAFSHSSHLVYQSIGSFGPFCASLTCLWNHNQRRPDNCDRHRNSTVCYLWYSDDNACGTADKIFAENESTGAKHNSTEVQSEVFQDQYSGREFNAGHRSR